MLHQPFLKCGEKMIVTSIEQQKKDPDKYNVFVDGDFAFSLYMQDILFFKIKENCEIAEERYNYIINEVVYIKAQDKALNFLGYKMRTEKEMRDKLETYDYSEGVIERVMEFLLKYGYVDDFKYALSYIRQTQRLKPMGRLGIKMKLREYGVDDETIENAILESDIDEVEDAYNLLIKKMRGKEEADEKEKKKYHDFLLRRGYSYDIIKDVFKRAEI